MPEADETRRGADVGVGGAALRCLCLRTAACLLYVQAASRVSSSRVRDRGHAGAGQRVARASDVWSLGVILYEMTYGRSPFVEATNYWQIMNSIADHKIEFPPIASRHALDCMKRCLRRNPAERPSVAQLLEHALVNPRAAHAEEKTRLQQQVQVWPRPPCSPALQLRTVMCAHSGLEC